MIGWQNNFKNKEKGSVRYFNIESKKGHEWHLGERNLLKYRPDFFTTEYTEYTETDSTRFFFRVFGVFRGSIQEGVSQ